MLDVKLISFPSSSLADIPASLRALADHIEQGEYGAVNTLAWIIDADYVPVRVGLMGSVPAVDATFITLCELAKMNLLSAMGKTGG